MPRPVVRPGPRSAAAAILVSTWAMTADPGVARGETIRFVGGREASLPAREVSDGEGRAFVEIEGPGGVHRVRRESVARILPDPTIPQRWDAAAAALAEAPDATPEAWRRLGWSATLHGMPPRARAAFERAVSGSEPDPIARKLLEAWKRWEATDVAGRSSERLDRLRAALPSDFEEIRGRWVVLLHRAEPAIAAERLRLLEDVAVTYYLWFLAHGRELSPPNEPMVHVHFPEVEGYRDFLRRHGADRFVRTRGYYHPAHRATFTHDLRDEPEFRARLAAARRAEAAPPDSEEGRDAARLRLLYEIDWRDQDHMAAAHESVHQLLTHSGLEAAPNRFPYWFHEGFAAQFEAMDSGRWGGIGAPPAGRSRDLRRAAPQPLSALLRDAGFGRSADPAPYARAWALVDHLRRERPGGLLDFLDLMNAAPDNSAASVRSAFENVFGDVESFDRELVRAARARLADPRPEPIP